VRQLRSILLAGGAGFIGSALARHLLRVEGLETLIVLDKLTCPGNRGNLIGPDQDPRVHFVEGDIQDRELTGHLLREHDITGVFNLAAETHSGRPLDSPVDFVHPNVLGTSRLLETCRVSGVPLLQCSTSKVYGQVSAPNRAVEINPLNPSTPYTASKASADLFCLAAARSHGQDIIITRSTSNYGPREHPEKLVPSLVHAAFHDLPVPIRGEGTQSRDWIHVDDHCRGMIAAFSKGQPGAVYLLGGQCERTELGMARSILEILGKPTSLITHVTEQPVKDARYAVDFSKAIASLSWHPQERFRSSFPLVVREIAANLRDPGAP